MTDRIERAAELLRQRVQSATEGEFFSSPYPATGFTRRKIMARTPDREWSTSIADYLDPSDADLIVLAVNLLKSGLIGDLILKAEFLDQHYEGFWDAAEIAERIADAILGSES